MTFFAFYKNLLDIKGAIGALALGLVISIFTDMTWLLAVLFFLIASSMITKVKYSYKRKKGVADGKIGERGINNVIANGFVPGFIAFFSHPLDQALPGLAGAVFLVSLSIAASDTFASELGIISQNAYMITTFRKVEPGIDGGVSLLGQASALLGGIIISVAGWLLVSDMFFSGTNHLLPASGLILVLVIITGWLGCQLDSVFGAICQQYLDILNNDQVNFLTISLGVIVFWVVLLNISIL